MDGWSEIHALILGDSDFGLVGIMLWTLARLKVTLDFGRMKV